MTLIGGAAIAWPGLARGQQSAMPVVGLLCSSTREGYAQQAGFLFAGLKEAGFIDGQNIRIEYRWADEHVDRLPMLAADLVQRQVSVIVTLGGSLPVRAAMAATTTIPIVFFIGTDPVKGGLVASLDHPGGNVTGVGGALNALGAKRLEKLRSAVPNAAPIAALLNPDNPNLELDTQAFKAAGRTSGVELVVVQARGTEQSLSEAFASMAARHVGGVVVNTEAIFTSRRSQIIALAAQYRIPVIYSSRLITEDGGLMSYGSAREPQRDAGRYVARILKGEKPADLPVFLPTRFDLAINLKTAKALGLTIPKSLLAEADEVIE